ncbi:MAG: DUF349 domain-containing protein [Pseudomonadales bacterium]
MLRKLFRGGGAQPPDPDEVPAARDSAPPSPAEALQALARDRALAEITALDDADALMDLALTLRGELRDAVLGHRLLMQPAGLAALEKRARSRDKAVNRHARRQLERYRALRQEADALRQRAEELAAALTRPGPDDRAARDRRRALHVRLLEAAAGYEALQPGLAAFDEALPALSLPLDDLAPPPEPEPAPAAEPSAEPAAAAADAATADFAAVEPGEDPFEAMVTDFIALEQAMLSGRAFDVMAAERQALTARWLSAADHRPPNPAQHAVFERVSHRYRELADAVARLQADAPAVAGLPPLPEPPADAPTAAAYWQAVAERRSRLRGLTRIRQQTGWPDWAAPVPEYTALLDAIAQAESDLGATDAWLANGIRTLEGTLEALTDAIDGGHLLPARQLMARAHHEHDLLPRASVKRLHQRLGQQANRLAELKDWQTFATTPKREALLDAMQALADAPLPPPDQADRIKALRREWQALGPVTQAADGRLADRFNAAAEAAFEVCRPYFAEQAERRRANLAERQRICDQLERYLDDTDWAHTDMRAAERIMRTAREEWRTFHPVERSAGKTLEKRFEGLQSRLHDKVKAEWDRNVRAREAIVAEAEALAAADSDVAGRIDRVKALQAHWREVGITPHGANQKLWRRLRAACDAVFEARVQSRQRAEAELDAVAVECRRVLDAFEAHLDGLDATDASEAELRDFRAQVDPIERLPAGPRRDLAARRNHLLSRYRDLLGRQARARSDARLEALRQQDEAEVAGSGSAADHDAVRRLAVRAELAAGLPSPHEDESLRLEVQVERLQAGLRGDAGSDSAEALLERWRALGPKDAAAAPLRQRFFAAVRLIG